MMKVVQREIPRMNLNVKSDLGNISRESRIWNLPANGDDTWLLVPWDLFELYSTGGWLINCVNWSCWSWPCPKSSFSSDSSKGESRGSGEKSAKMATFQNSLFHRILYNFLPNRSSKFTVPTLSMCFTTIRIRMRSRNLSKSKIPLALRPNTTDETGNPKKLRFNFLFLLWVALNCVITEFLRFLREIAQLFSKRAKFSWICSEVVGDHFFRENK